MKKVLYFLLLAAIALSLISCMGWEEPHTHSFNTEFTTNESYHWRNCDSCFQVDDRGEHSWKEEPVAVTLPTSDKRGEEIYACSVCGLTRSVYQNKLPDRMSLTDWNTAFSAENFIATVAIANEVTTYAVSLPLALPEGEDSLYMYADSITEAFDFSANYLDFSHYGDGIYKCDELYIYTAGVKTLVKNIVITFNGKELATVSYKYLNGRTYSINFSSFGEAQVELPAISAELWKSITSESSYNNVTLNTKKLGIFDNSLLTYTEKYSLTEYGEMYFYTDKTMDITKVLDFTSEERLRRQEFFSILSLTNLTDWSYSVEENKFVCQRAITTTNDTYENIIMIIEDGVVKSISCIGSDATILITLSDYGTTYIRPLSNS